MFIPWTSPDAMQNFAALWQVSPMLVPIFCSVFGYYYRTANGLPRCQRTANETPQDLPHLKNLYLVTGLSGLVFHFFCISKIVLSRQVSLTSVFWPDFSAEAKPFGEGLRAIFMTDFWGFYVATYVWLCMAVWDVKRVGRSTVNVRKAAALIALGHLVVGPGAVMSAVWYWRELALAKTRFNCEPYYSD
jgi:hypothetical protein